MKKIEQTSNQIIFSAEMDETLANSIRRYVNHIPMVAIDEVEISKNDSALYDETVAHRIGLIPLKEGKVKEGKLKLETKKEGIVHSGDFEGNIDLVHKDIPITILSSGQEMQIEATTKVGTGSEHSKFSPGLMFYRNVTEVSLDKEFKEDVEKVCPNAKITEKGDRIIVRDDGKEDIADVCEGIANKQRKEAEVKVEGEVIVTIESFGQIDSEEVFKRAIDNLKKDLKEVEKLVSKA